MTFDRIVQGIVSMCLSNRCYPVIKKIKNNDICDLIAREVYSFLDENNDIVTRNCSREPNSILLIYDRKEDPVTPLLTQWTYQVISN